MKNRVVIDLCDYMSDIMYSEPHILSTKFKDQDEEEQVINVLDNNMFKSYFEYFFYNYSMISFKELTSEEVIFRFNNMWRIFQHEEKENLNKIVQGYYWDYVPVYNYDRTEKWTDVRTGNETDARKLDYDKKETNTKTTGSYKDVETPDGVTIQTVTPEGEKSTSTIYGQDVNFHEVSTMDSANYRSKDKDTRNTRTDTTTDSFDNYAETTTNTFDDFTNTTERTFDNYNVQVKEDARLDKDDNTHTYNDVTDTHNGRMFGNIGVTTNVDMIEGEFKLRVHNLGYEWLKKFFDKYFIMI